MKLLNEVNWYGRAMGRYGRFSGRATRSEFWYFTLVSGLMSFGASLVDDGAHTGGTLNVLVLLAHALPSLSVFARRLHDIGRTGWWFLALFTVVGIIPVFVFLCRRGATAPNRYGVPDGTTGATDPSAGTIGAALTDTRDPIREIERLAELHARGAITDTEFARMKADVLSGPDGALPASGLAPAPRTTAQ